MQKEVLSLVKDLTSNDKKTLSEKVAKLFEEGGEVAKSVLPYSNAAGTLHRVVHRGKILEEVSDVLLVALSIAYDLGFDDSDINSMMYKKAMYWGGLQASERSINTARIPHEIHVTVASVPDLERFKGVCAEIAVKPIILNLHNDGSPIVDMMTSQVVVGTTPDAFREMENTVKHLRANGYHVIREKIEVAPWHPAVPNVNNNLVHRPGCYFESHIETYVEHDNVDSNMQALVSLMKVYDAHVSSNIFKWNRLTASVMVTVRRTYETLEAFNLEVARIRAILKESGFNISDKEIIEYAIYDSKESHDDDWLGK